MNRTETSGKLALIVATVIWGASFVLAKIALAELEVTHVVLYRFLFSALPMLPFLLRGPHKPTRKDLPLFLWTGFLMVPVTIGLQFEGLARSNATATALMIGTGAPLLAGAAVLFEGETLGKGWWAILISSLGVLALVGMPGPGSGAGGSLLVLLSMFVSVFWIITSKRLTQRYAAFQATGWIVVFGTLFLIPLAFLRAGLPSVNLSTATWLALLGLGPGCTIVAYVAWNWGVTLVGAGRAGIFINIEPVSGALLGVLCLGDELSWGVVFGGALILGSAVVLSWPGVAGAQGTEESRREAVRPSLPAPPRHRDRLEDPVPLQGSRRFEGKGNLPDRGGDPCECDKGAGSRRNTAVTGRMRLGDSDALARSLPSFRQHIRELPIETSARGRHRSDSRRERPRISES